MTTDKGRPGLLVSERCENLIWEFLGYKEEQVGKSVATDHALDDLAHALEHEGRHEADAALQQARDALKQRGADD